MSALLKSSLQKFGSPALMVQRHYFLQSRKNSTNPENSPEQGTSSIQSNSHYDVIISGGGLVGTTLACAIAKNKVLSDLRVLLLEGAPPLKPFTENGNYSNRVSALNRCTVNLMKSIGAWDTVTSMRYKPIKQMQVWDASSNAAISFSHDEILDNIAYIVENDLVLHAVYKVLEGHKNIEIRNNSRVNQVDLIKDGAKKGTVKLNEGKEYTCELLIGADGANSLIRKQMNVDTFSLQYRQKGLVATLILEDAGDNSTAWQRFLPTGPVALLPLNEKTSSLVWSTTPEEAERLQKIPSEEFVHALNEAFYNEYSKDNITNTALNIVEKTLGCGFTGIRQYPPRVLEVLPNSRASFPLGFTHASSYVGEGVALIGDAAHRIHPLAGQGVNLGFGDVSYLVKILSDAHYSGINIGDSQLLLKYEKERLSKNLPIMIGVHGLQNLYNTDFPPVVLLRSLGLLITQNIPPLKKAFMQRAMG